MVQATSRRAVATSRRTTRVLAVLALVVVVVIVALILGVVGWSGASLSPDASALARITLSPLAGSLSSAQAFGPGGRRIPLAVDADRLTPLTTVAPGERITVDVTIRRPGWIGWALGATHTERLELRAPVAHPDAQWLTVAQGSPLVVRFDRPVFAVAYRIADRVTEVALDRGQRVVALPRATAAGSLQLAASAASWERLGSPTAVSWFPPSSLPVVVVDPAPGVTFSPAAPIRLTFSRPLSDVFGSARPQFVGGEHGVWREVDSHTLVFQPAGVGVALGTQLRLQLPRAVAVTGPSGVAAQTTSEIAWTVPLGSTLRLQQLLAQAGYLPVDWTPAGAAVARRRARRSRPRSTRRRGRSPGAIRTRPPSCRRCGRPASRTTSPAAR